MLVAERDASGIDVVGLLRQRVAGEVDAGSLKPLRARGEGLGVRGQRRFAEVVRGVLQRRRHLGTVQHRRAVDAAVADHDDIVLGGQAARLGKRHIGDARAAVEIEDWRQRVGGASQDPGHRQRDQARLRARSVLRHDQRAAVRGHRTLLGRVSARVHGQLAGLAPCGTEIAAPPGAEPDVGQAEQHHPDNHKGNDPSRGVDPLCLHDDDSLGPAENTMDPATRKVKTGPGGVVGRESRSRSSRGRIGDSSLRRMTGGALGCPAVICRSGRRCASTSSPQETRWTRPQRWSCARDQRNGGSRLRAAGEA